jgi:thiol-disulfide isomerase/thioredoxin
MPPVPRTRRRRRRAFVALLALGLVALVGAGATIALQGNNAKVRIVTIPLADRNASRSLIQAAEAVGFQPADESGAGVIEGKPASAAKPPSTAGLLPLGAGAPGFVLRTPSGTRVSLADSRGKATLVEFFATTCPLCNAEAPHLRKLALSLPASKYAFVSVNAATESPPRVFAYHVYYGLPFPAVLDPGGGGFHLVRPVGPVSKSYGVSRFPTFYVLDRHGRVTWRSVGEQPDALLRQQLVHAATGAPVPSQPSGPGGASCTAAPAPCGTG